MAAGVVVRLRCRDSIKQIRAATPVLGTAWTIFKDNLVLRVTGDLTPSVEKAYEAAFTG